MPGVHRTVDVADQMDQELDIQGLHAVGQCARAQFRYDFIQSRQDIAGRIFRHRLIRFTRVDICIMPRCRVLVRFVLPDKIHPRRVIHQGMSVQNPIQFFRYSGFQIIGGDGGDNIMAFHSPAECSTATRRQANRYQQAPE